MKQPENIMYGNWLTSSHFLIHENEEFLIVHSDYFGQESAVAFKVAVGQSDWTVNMLLNTARFIVDKLNEKDFYPEWKLEDIVYDNFNNKSYAMVRRKNEKDGYNEVIIEHRDFPGGISAPIVVLATDESDWAVSMLLNTAKYVIKRLNRKKFYPNFSLDPDITFDTIDLVAIEEVRKKVYDKYSQGVKVEDLKEVAKLADFVANVVTPEDIPEEEKKTWYVGKPVVWIRDGK